MSLAADVAEALVKVVTAVLEGDPDKAANEARIAGETVAAKKSFEASFEAGKAARAPQPGGKAR